MPTKFQLITELYDQTVQSVTGSYQSWTGFLRAACYNYKCPFDDQILIYAQRPDATAVLEMERWNRQFGRWVNRGAKSIAVFGDDGQNCLKLYLLIILFRLLIIIKLEHIQYKIRGIYFLLF